MGSKLNGLCALTAWINALIIKPMDKQGEGTCQSFLFTSLINKTFLCQLHFKHNQKHMKQVNPASSKTLFLPFLYRTLQTIVKECSCVTQGHLDTHTLWTSIPSRDTCLKTITSLSRLVSRLVIKITQLSMNQTPTDWFIITAVLPGCRIPLAPYILT